MQYILQHKKKSLAPIEKNNCSMLAPGRSMSRLFFSPPLHVSPLFLNRIAVGLVLASNMKMPKQKRLPSGQLLWLIKHGNAVWIFLIYFFNFIFYIGPPHGSSNLDIFVFLGTFVCGLEVSSFKNSAHWSCSLLLFSEACEYICIMTDSWS